MRQTIVICDDDEGILDVTKIILEELGFTVILDNKGENIFRLVNEQEPVLVLLDLWMPGHGGKSIAHQLKSDPATKHLPILLLSANKDLESVATEVGAEGFLAKPFDIAELEAVVRRLTTAERSLAP